MKFPAIFLLALLIAEPAFGDAHPKQLLASGRVDDAVQTLQQQITTSPKDAEAYNLLCRAYFMMEDWDRAIGNCERARNLDPQNSMYWLWLGRAYGEKADRAGVFTAAGLVKKVRSSFERAVQLDPQGWEARSDLAEFYLEAPSIVGGGKDKARQQADALMSLNPAMGHWILARIAEKDKNPTEAERQFRAEIAERPSARGWLDLAIFFRYQNRFEEMEQALVNMQTAPLDRPESIMDGASLLFRAGRDFPLAIKLLRRYLSDHPVEEGPVFKARYMLGQLLEKQGDRQGAAAEYRAALDLFHNYARAQQDLKRVAS